MLRRRFRALAATLFLACSAPTAPAARRGDSPPPVATTFTACGESRPEICTHQYQPVCARVDTGIRCIKAPCPSTDLQTFPNACAACMNAKVTDYAPGPCVASADAGAPEAPR